MLLHIAIPRKPRQDFRWVKKNRDYPLSYGYPPIPSLRGLRVSEQAEAIQAKQLILLDCFARRFAVLHSTLAMTVCGI